MRDSTSFKKVLLIDEDDRLRSGCCHELKSRGYEVVELSTGKDALERLRRERFDMVVLEVDLPDLDGMTLYLNAARANPEIKKEDFLFATSSAKLTYTLSRTSLNYRKKPFRPHELADQVDLLLGGVPLVRPRGDDASERGERRVERRLPWEEWCRLTPATGTASIPIRKASTEDISGGGLRVRYAGGLSIVPGINVMVEIRSLRIKAPARVVWSVGSGDFEATSGLRFFNELPPSSLTTVLTR